MAILLKQLTAAAQTGNNTHSAVGVEGSMSRAAVQFVVEAVGGTPTVTFKAQGSLDGSNWYDLQFVSDSTDTGAHTTTTVTGVGATVEFLDLAGDSRFYQFFRLVTTLNTNVTYHAELWVKP
jgi:hypothetical protein